MSKDFNQLTKRERKELSVRLKSDDFEVRKKANEELIGQLEGYIWYNIHHKYQHYKQEWEAMYNTAVVGIIEAATNYNPEMSLTTYFNFIITHELFTYVAEFINHSTIHYFSTGLKIERAINELEQKNEKVTMDKIVEMTKYSKGVIQNSLVYKFRMIDGVSSYDSSMELVENELFPTTPSIEETIIENEVGILLRRALCILEPMTRAVVILRANNVKYKDIAKRLNISLYAANKLYDEGIEFLKKYFNETYPLGLNIIIQNAYDNHDWNCVYDKDKWNDILELKDNAFIEFAL